jgi:hypothetical protein
MPACAVLSRGVDGDRQGQRQSTLRMTEPRWNRWATLWLVQFDHQKQAVPRAVRLSGATARVGDAVRVGVSGIEVEGRITAIESSILRVDVSARVPAHARRAIPDPRSRPERRSSKKKMAKASAPQKSKRRLG